MNTPSTTVQTAQQLLAEREVVGLAKYGTTVDRTDLQAGDWLQHAIEEASDLLLYLIRLQQTMRPAQSSPAEEPERRKAPWPDFAGNPIFEGDWIVHPSGQRARVRFDPSETSSPGWSEWRCDYDGLLHGMSLALQIGDKGMAVVEVEKPNEDPERAAYLARWKDAPEWAEWRVKDQVSGDWYWFRDQPPFLEECEPRPEVKP